MVDTQYDVIVAGAGSAGVAAAVGAAAIGSKVLIVERAGFAGGAATLSQVLAWCGFYPQRAGAVPEAVVGGVGRQALDRLAELGMDVAPYYSASGNWPIRLNPEATKIALDRVLAASGVDIAYHCDLVLASVSGTSIQSVALRDPRGVRDVAAKGFVDATGDGELAFVAGATACPAHGDGKRLQPASFPVRISGVDAGVALDKAARARAVAGMERRHGRAELRADGGIMTTLPGTAELWWLAIEAATNGLDAHDLAAAERDARELAWMAVQQLRLIEGFERASLSSTGPKIGIRESRHARSVEPLSDANLADGLIPDDTIALGGWPMEKHSGPGKVEYRSIGGNGTYGIPVGAIRSADRSNLLLAGRCIGAQPDAYASARVMGTAFATGHAAGVAAAMPGADASALRRELLRQGAII